MGAKEETQQESRRFRGMPVTTTLLVGLFVVVGVGGWLAVRAISGAICGSYNDISNDFCDEWHYDTPPSGALPVPPRWETRWEKLDCGSGGCGNRLYVLSPPTSAEGGVAGYLSEIQALGWRTDASGEARLGDLHLDVASAADGIPALLIPKRLARMEFVFVALAICGEGTVCG